MGCIRDDRIVETTSAGLRQKSFCMYVYICRSTATRPLLPVDHIVSAVPRPQDGCMIKRLVLASFPLPMHAGSACLIGAHPKWKAWNGTLNYNLASESYARSTYKVSSGRHMTRLLRHPPSLPPPYTSCN